MSATGRGRRLRRFTRTGYASEPPARCTGAARFAWLMAFAPGSEPREQGYPAPMTPRRARALFNVEAHRFRAAFPTMPPVRFRIAARHFLPNPAARDLAWFDNGVIVLTRAALARSEATVRGILRHELGHAADARIDAPGSEARADRLAGQASGPVNYDREGLQTTGKGTARPGWLHR